MAFASFDARHSSAPVSEINMVPLIDVMLVLLVIFIITAPLLTHAVRIDLPRASSHPTITQPENIQLGVKANGEVYWNGVAIEKSTLASRMAAAARLNPPPEVHLRADRATEYQKVAEVMSAAAEAGLVKIGFVTDPTAQK